MSRGVRGLVLAAAVSLASASAATGLAGEVLAIQAKETLTALEMNHGDELRFRLRSGREVSLVLEDTDAAIVERVVPGGIVYRFSCRVRIEGQPMELRRFVCSQECFYEPYVVEGLRIWPDTVKKVFDLVPIRYPHQGNLQCLPRKDARFAVQDALLRICPQETHAWLEEEPDFIDIGRCYNGDDCYLGPYLGQACHVGLDINHPKGNALLAPIDFDTQAYFNSLERGHNNNRWRGIRRWKDDDVWALQTHHLIDLLVTQNTPLKAGTRYATSAGVHVGSHEHTHFEFKIGRKRPEAPLPASDDPLSIACPINFQDESDAAQAASEVLHLDPWIVFWQIFEDRKARRGEIRAAMTPPAAVKTGRPVVFSASGSRPGAGQRGLSYRWTFGDGGCAAARNPQYVFARPGIYPVTLVVDDGRERAACTRHVAVSGDSVAAAVLALAAPDEPSFRVRPAHVADVYGRPVEVMPHTLRFVARATRPMPKWKTVTLRNLGGGVLPGAGTPQVEYATRSGWLKTELTAGGSPQLLRIVADPTGLEPGSYAAMVAVDCLGAVNSPQHFRVELEIRREAASAGTTVDDRDDGFYATPYYWVGHRFCRCREDRRGHQGTYLTNGSRPVAGEFARFTPDLQAGTYEVALIEATPFHADTEFDVRVRHRGGETTVRVRPRKSRRIGTFEFDDGTDGFVEILGSGSTGLVIADAVVYQAQGGRPHR